MVDPQAFVKDLPHHSAPIPDPTHALSSGPSILGMVSCLFLLGAFLLWLFFRYIRPMMSPKYANPLPENSAMKVLQTLKISPKQSLFLVKVAKQVLVIGSSEKGLSYFCEFPESDLDGSEDDFSPYLQKATASFSDAETGKNSV